MYMIYVYFKRILVKIEVKSFVFYGWNWNFILLV